MLEILQGDWIEQLATLPDQSVQCCVTSPPYWGLRDYNCPGQLGLEPTPEAYVAKLVAGFEQVRRVLKNDGTLWLNLGDSYAGSGKGAWDNKDGGQKEVYIPDSDSPQTKIPKVPAGLKPKDLVGIPWMVAFALRAQGWYLRSDIIWAKPNCMPESVLDRPTRSHEYIFLLTKQERYFYDAEAIKEEANMDYAERYNHAFNNGQKELKGAGRPGAASNTAGFKEFTGFRNKRSVWTVSPMPYAEAHFATYPPSLIKPCILAGSRPGDTILDPFAGSGTTGMVALELARNALLIELNPAYIKLIETRTNVTPGLPLYA